MSRYVNVGTRLLLVLGFLVGMPILALPPVAAWCEQGLYPQPKRRVVAARPLPKPPVEPLGTRPWPKMPPTVAQVEYLAPDSTLPLVTRAPDDLEALAAEVQALGASSYRLEQVQTEPLLFRFVAEFESAGVPPRRWQHVATNRDPAAAMRKVLAEILAER
jgi:hypothetical protein